MDLAQAKHPPGHISLALMKRDIPRLVLTDPMRSPQGVRSSQCNRLVSIDYLAFPDLIWILGVIGKRVSKLQ